MHQASRQFYMAQFGLSTDSWRPSFEELKLLPHITSVVPASVSKLVYRPTRGLINMGNTCFLNVVIQALTHTPVLRDYLLADLHRCGSAVRSRNCLACEMIRVTQEIYSPVQTPFVPSNLLYTIWLQASHMAGYEQRDAHEFLITLLTLIHGHLVGEAIGCPTPAALLPPTAEALVDEASSSSTDDLAKRKPQLTALKQLPTPCHRVQHCHRKRVRLADDEDEEVALVPVGRNKVTDRQLAPTTCLQPRRRSDKGFTTSCSNASSSASLSRSSGSSSSSSQTSVASSRDTAVTCDCIVHQVFFGDLESVINYQGCGHTSSTVDPFLDLSLDVIQRGSTSLHACLISYFRPEMIDGLILCSQCNMGRPAVKKFSILHLPNVLCFYLKRCHQDSKINTSITFPADLDLAPYLPQVEGDLSAWQDRYSLYAVLNHTGQSNSGHYTAYIRAGPNSWCLCDDQKIVPVGLDHVLQTDAYVLLYHKNLLAMRT